MARLSWTVFFVAAFCRWSNLIVCKCKLRLCSVYPYDIEYFFIFYCLFVRCVVLCISFMCCFRVKNDWLSEQFRHNELYNIKRYINSFVYFTLLYFTLTSNLVHMGVVIGAVGVRVRVRVSVRDDWQSAYAPPTAVTVRKKSWPYSDNVKARRTESVHQDIRSVRDVPSASRRLSSVTDERTVMTAPMRRIISAVSSDGSVYIILRVDAIS